MKGEEEEREKTGLLLCAMLMMSRLGEDYGTIFRGEGEPREGRTEEMM